MSSCWQGGVKKPKSAHERGQSRKSLRAGLELVAVVHGLSTFGADLELVELLPQNMRDLRQAALPGQQEESLGSTLSS